MADYTPVYMILLGSVVMFGGGMAIALAWAFKNGQLENFHRGAVSIFDADEPLGMSTDAFPTGYEPDTLLEPGRSKSFERG